LSLFFSCSRKEYYDVDYCYERNEDNDLIFSREIKPLILRVFEGCNPTIITCGARGSGKTYVIQVGFSFPSIFFFFVSSYLLIYHFCSIYG
jgi:kinesin family protein 22